MLYLIADKPQESQARSADELRQENTDLKREVNVSENRRSVNHKLLFGGFSVLHARVVFEKTYCHKYIK